MTILCSECGKWYLTVGKTCPVCGHTMTQAEADAYARVKAEAKKEKPSAVIKVERPRNGEERRRWKEAGAPYNSLKLPAALTCISAAWMLFVSWVDAEMGLVFCPIVVIFALIWFSCAMQNRSSEQKVSQTGGIEALEAKALEQRMERAKQIYMRNENNRPVSAVLISTTNKRSALGTVARATVGGAIFGLGGAIGGAASMKSEATHATFGVKYASGRTATETVDIGSRRFNELSALLHE